ncbi:NADPH:quinone reductase [Linnemannia hyalina]|uniref:Probable quinone oxidoreductase n=1 Tax=Linnemannia hyalina TaxID=64524 RepID=A0A9P7XZR0_9FUNG|nr:NADPH:quinone reductase [Linnemannia hyalina]
MVNSTIRAIRVEEYGDASVLKYTIIPRPIPQHNQVLVKVAYAGINFGDVGQRSGFYPTPVPFTAGGEGSGEIVELGPDVEHGFKVGDRVTFMAYGAYTDYAVVDTGRLGKLPDHVSLELGAAFLAQGLTAVALTEQAYTVKKDDWVVIHAAAGGMGLLLTQLSHRLGAHVIGTVSSNEKAALARANGADHVVVIPANKSASYEALEKKVHELTNGQGVHVVYDSIGQATFESSLEIARRLGTLVLFGSTSGDISPQSLTRLAGKNLKVTWVSLLHYTTTFEEFDELYQKTLKLLDDGGLKVQVSKVYEFEDAKQAHLDLEGRKTTGKLLLKVN